MRKVIYREYDVENIDGFGPCPTIKERGEALFHQWGLCLVGGETETISSAIIELADGTVKNIPAEHVRFISGEVKR